MTFRFSIIALFALTLGLGCSSSSTGPGDDGGSPGTDLGTAGHDGAVGTDSGPITFDAGPDTGSTPVDSGPRPDGAPPVDLGPMPTIMGSVGSACGSAADCSMLSGAMCEMTVGMGGFMYSFPGGYCTEPCSTMMPCPTGSACVPFIAFCAKTCSTDADCRASEGYTCMASPLGGGDMYCLPPMGMTGARDGGTPVP